jgi:DNA-binding CsgD family transcriptional regulator
VADQETATLALAGRAAYEERAWSEAYRLLSAVESLDAGGLERLAVAAHLVGRDEESARAWSAAADQWWAAGDIHRGASSAFWLAIDLLLRGEHARSAGWMTTARRVLEESPSEGPGPGYLCAHQGLLAYITGNGPQAVADFSTAVDTARRFADQDLTTFAQVGLGEALVRTGSVTEGMATLDEAIVTVSGAEVSPINVGLAYCAGLGICQEVLDLGRAREWTRGLSEWCAGQPDLVPYRGQCLVHRSQIMQFDGDWADALGQARLAEERLVGHPAEGEAHYQEAEMLRLLGDAEAAARAYQRASDEGRDPQPGLALLRLAEGRNSAALAMVRRALDETSDDCRRARLLAVAVEIVLRSPDPGAAHGHAEELSAIARRRQAPMMHALADHALGSVLLADGDAIGALSALRRAATRWRELGAPYEVARARELVGIACSLLGDQEAAGQERAAALATFTSLGAEPDVIRLSGSQRPTVAGLTAREVEVLALVAAGRSNREIARELMLSEHTVRRHLQNIFAKTDVANRAGATAYAFQHGLA